MGSTFWLGMVIGGMLGCSFGALIIAAFTIGKLADEREARLQLPLDLQAVEERLQRQHRARLGGTPYLQLVPDRPGQP